MVGVGMFTPAAVLLAAFVVKAQLAGAVTPASHMTRALSTSSSSTECTTEVVACASDPACVACANGYDASAAACLGSTSDGYNIDTCGEIQDLLCCAAAGCESTIAFGAFLGCATADFGCGVVDISTCPLAGGAGSDEATAGDRGTTTTGSSTAVDDTSSTAGDRGFSTTDSTTATDDASASTSVPSTTTTDSSTAMDDTSSTTTLVPGVSTTYSATAKDYSVSSTSACIPELEACSADLACIACLQSSNDAAGGCQGSDDDSENLTCSEKEEINCCLLGQLGDCQTDDLLVSLIDCAADEADGCGFRTTDCAGGGDSSARVGGDDDAGASDGVEADEGPGDSSSLVGGDGDEEAEEANGVEADEDEEPEEADAADADADAATPSAMVGGTTTLFVAAAVSWALVCA